MNKTARTAAIGLALSGILVVCAKEIASEGRNAIKRRRLHRKFAIRTYSCVVLFAGRDTLRSVNFRLISLH